MKFAVLGFGVVAVASSLFGCSGSASTAPPARGDAGAQPDAAEADASSDASAGSAAAGSDDGSATDAGARDGGAGGVGGAAADAGGGQAGEGGASQTCQPGALSCDGAKVQVCNASGTGLTLQKACSLSQTCSDGACLDIVCVPNTTFCGDGDVWVCSADGTSSTLTTHCSADQFCLDKAGVATCNATACFGGDPMCAGTLATHCKPDGSGPKPGGDDCTAAGQICYSGACRDLVCAPGQKVCDNGNVYLCAEAGTSRTLLSTCAAGQSCDQATGSCQTRICEPGKIGCDSTRVAACNVSGTGWVQSGVDCAASSSICLAGVCKPVVCSANQAFCKNDAVYSCSADGTAATLGQDCIGYGEHCVSYGAGVYCNYYFCTPGAAGCNGSLLTTCKADGTGWVAGGTDCAASNGICLNAACAPKVCAPATRFCAGGNVQACDYLGASSSLSQFCGYGTYCKAQGNTADCVPTPCLPDTDGCASEKFGHCASDGLSVVAGATDCGAATQVCTLQGCAASAKDTVATANQLEAGNPYLPLIVNVLSVESGRKLTGIEMYLTLSAAPTLTWVVYQQNFVNGYAEFDLKYEKPTTGSGTGFQSSGPISLELAAGTTYAIGVSVGGTFVDYFDNATMAPSLNFAHVIGSMQGSLAAVLGGYYISNKLYNSRITTTAP